MSLKTSWTAPGMGATVGELRRLLGKITNVNPAEEAIKTNLEVEPYLQALTCYDRDRAEIAIDFTLRRGPWAAD